MCRCLVGLLIALVFVVMLTSYAGAAAKVKLTAVLCCSTEEVDVLKQVFTEFQAENPDIALEYWQLEGSYNEAMATRLAGGVAPDLIFGDRLGFARWSAFLLPIDAYVNKLGLTTKYTNPGLLSMMQFNGVQYGLPFRIGTKVLLYQPDMFQEAGLAEPPSSGKGWTTQDFEKVATKLTLRDSSGNLLKWGSVKHTIWSVLDQFAVPRDPSYRKAMYDSQPMIDAVQFMVDAIYRWGYAYGWPYQAPEWIAAKKVAMVPDIGAYNLPTFRALGSVPWKLTAMPGAPQGADASGYAVSNSTKYPDEAVRVAAYVSTNPKAQQLMAKVAIPVTPQGILSFTRQDVGRGLESFAEAVNRAQFLPIDQRALKVDTGKVDSLLWDQVMFGIVEKDLPVVSTLQSINRQIQAIYDEAQ